MTASQNITPGTLTIHADRGSSMTSKPVAVLLANLKIGRTHSRPHVSNDNPYSEAGFKTLKYCPAFPERFGSREDAIEFCTAFFGHYNHFHRHSGIGLHTPASVHYGTATDIREDRARVLNAAYAAHPERFVNRPPSPPLLPEAAWINKPVPKDPRRSHEMNVSQPAYQLERRAPVHLVPGPAHRLATPPKARAPFESAPVGSSFARDARGVKDPRPFDVVPGPRQPLDRSFGRRAGANS